MNNNYIINKETDELLMKNHTLNYNTVVTNRSNRSITACQTYMQTLGFNTTPKKTLQELESRLTRLSSLHQNENYYSKLDVDSQIQILQNQIANNDFCLENTPEWEYRSNWLSHYESFEWPSLSEINIREQEAQELLTLLNN